MTFQSSDNSQTSNLTFIDTNLTNYKSLIPDANDNQVILIDSQSNGIEQITEALENYSNLDSISILSHGDIGSIQLGDTYLSNSNLDSYQDELTVWGSALSATGDFLLYGCNVAASQAGLDFVDKVADLTSADVAASNDLTGNATLGGDWTLEVTTGAIETPTFVITEHNHILRMGFRQLDFSQSNLSSFNSDNSSTYGYRNFNMGALWKDWNTGQNELDNSGISNTTSTNTSNNSITSSQTKSIDNSVSIDTNSNQSSDTIIENTPIINFDSSSDTNSSGLEFNFTYDSNVTTAQKTAFEYAGKAWADVLSDDVTVNLHISMVNNSDLPSNTLGGAVPFFHQGTSYSDFRTKLEQDINSTDDQTAVANLRTDSVYSVAMTGGNGTGSSIIVGNSSSSVTLSSSTTGSSTTGNITTTNTHNLNQVATTRANAKALGLIDTEDSKLDGIIVMNNLEGTSVSWEYNYLNSLESNEIDFTTVAIHEVGHTLGFVSLVDGLSDENYDDLEMLNSSATSLDLYRHRGSTRFIGTQQSTFALGSNETKIADFSIGSQDVGVVSLGGEYNPNIYSDSYQGSHWKNEDNAGIMDPLLELSVRRDIAELDLRAMDVMGWDRQVGSSSQSSLWSQAQNEANATGNINRNVEVDQMLADWRWARRGSRDRLRQEGNIAQFLAQEGFFSVGSFRESFDFSSVNPAPTDNSIVENNPSNISAFSSNNNLAVETNFDITLAVDLPEVITTDEGIDYEQMLALVTKGLSDDELSQLSLDDLGKLIEQQFAESII